MKKSRMFTGAAALGAMLAFTASDAAAQACAGFPAAPGQFSVGARWTNSAGILADQTGTALGVEGSWNQVGRIGLFGIVNLISPDDDGDQQAAVGLGGSYSLGDLIPPVPAWLDICPVASITYTQVDGNARFGIPLGIGFGTTIGVPEGPFTLIPYAIPTFRLVRVGLDDIDWQSNFGVGLGALARFANLVYVGIEFDRMFVDDADFDVGFRAGLAFPR